MTIAEAKVNDHLDAVFAYDWERAKRELSPNCVCHVVSGGMRHGYDDTNGAYRFVTQAWDFIPTRLSLNEIDDGAVVAELKLSNLGGRMKSVSGRYHLTAGLIASIELTDGVAQADPNG